MRHKSYFTQEKNTAKKKPAILILAITAATSFSRQESQYTHGSYVHSQLKKLRSSSRVEIQFCINNK